PGNLSPSVPLRRPVHTGNPPPRLVVSDLEEHVPDLLSGPRARVRDRGRRRAGLGRAHVSRRARGLVERHGGAHRPRTCAATPAPRRRFAWLAPAFAAAATALVLVLAFVPLLPRILPADPAQRLMRSVVAEHERALMWGARRPEAIPTALPWLTQESGIDLTRVFAGDDLLAFRGAEPVYLEGRRGIALHYR